ncbi:MAG TPA: hypothetical protein VLK27_03065 [Chthoniobacterales bacterium]|nr:hypothetical protein [Chthoniobacterales bacterium]
MKTNILKIGATSFAVTICIWCTQAFAQTTTVTTTKGAFNEYVPGSETMVVRAETGTTPLRYTVTKQTTIVDESGAPVSVERISPGSPLSIQYTGTGDHLVASRIVIQKPTAVTEQQTTTTTTRDLTHHEKHELKEAQKHEKKAEKEQAEAQKDKDKLDHDQ